MKTTISLACCLLCLCLVGASRLAPARMVSASERVPARMVIPLGQPLAPGEVQKSEKFGALAVMPRRARTTANVDVYINRYTSDEDAKALGGLLFDNGPDALLKALEKAEPMGNITFTGRVSFYNLKLIRSRPTETGRRIIAVGDRPIRFLEAYYSGRSRDYEFGILILDLKSDKKGKEKGEGSLIYAAKVKILDGNKLELENYGIDPVRLMGVRKL